MSTSTPNNDTEKFSHLQQTPLLSEHLHLGARVVDFGGWALPVNYGSQVDEHHAVRNDAGMFDVSHMTVSDVTGTDTIPFLQYLLANDINKANSNDGKALYSCMLNEQGGVIDDLIVYRLNDQHCRLVTNAATNEKDMAWITQQATDFSVTFKEQPSLALIAVQGPNAITKVAQTFPNYAELTLSLKRFQGSFVSNEHDEHTPFIGRTGYTGEDGVEIILPAADAAQQWQALINAGIQPCGLGARDTLRLEAGMALYGNDLDENHTPIESGLKWTVSLNERDFIGKTSLLQEPKFKMIGLILEDRGVLRGHQPVIFNEVSVGEITSGTFSPTLEKSIAIARINADTAAETGDVIHVEVRNKRLQCRVSKYPFISFK
ncbi:MAG: glycine cleavage system aminomethyltransferase GcvT [Arenicella sp.]